MKIMKVTLLVVIYLLISCTVFGQTELLKAGAALRTITPDPLIPVSGGVGIPNPATIKQGELFVRVMVLEKGKNRFSK